MGRVGEWLKARVIIFCESVKIYKAFFAPYCLLFAYGMALSSPVSVIIRRILHAGGIQPFDHLIKRRFPNVLKPVCMSEPFYEGRTNCIVCADKCATIPSFSKGYRRESGGASRLQGNRTSRRQQLQHNSRRYLP